MCPRTCTLWKAWALGPYKEQWKEADLELTGPSAESHSIHSRGSSEPKSRLLPTCRVRIDFCILGLLLMHLGPARTLSGLPQESRIITDPGQ